MSMFDYGGALSTRHLSTEEQELTWDVSTCLFGFSGKGLINPFKSPEFSFAGATWYLFLKHQFPPVGFGIDLLKASSSDEVFDCSGKITFQAASYDVSRSFDLKFKYGKGIPFVRKEVRDGGFTSNTSHAIQGFRPNIVCRIKAKKLTDITFSSGSSAAKAPNQRRLTDFPLLMSKFDYAGALSTRYLSTEEKELTWYVSGCLRECGGRGKDFKSPEFALAGATCNFFLKHQDQPVSFGINVNQKFNSSDEVFDCSCKIAIQTSCTGISELDISKCFTLKFKSGKGMPFAAEDFFRSDYFKNATSYHMQDLPKIICRIKAKKLTDNTFSSGSSAAKAPNQRSFTDEGDEIPMVNFESKVCHDLKNKLDSGENSDVIIQIGEQSFNAHRSILEARSSVFAAMLRHHMKERDTGVLNIKDCDASSFPVFLEFLYCGSTEKLSLENVFCLYRTSDKYDAQDLKRKCLQFMEINLSVDNFCETIHLSLQYSETDLFKQAIAFFARKMEDIIITPKWQDFISENPIQGNDIYIKALACGRHDN